MAHDDTPAASGKGKGKLKSLTTIPQPTSRETVKNDQKSRDNSVPVTKPPGIGHSWETGVVPSSVPDQDFGTERSSRAKPTRGKGRGRGGKSSTARLTPKEKPTSNRLRPQRRTATAVSSYAESSDEEGQDELLTGGFNIGHDDDDNKTEPVDDGCDEPSVANSSHNKRKRAGSKPSNAGTKSKASTKAATLPVVTPTTKQTKRLRSLPSTSRGATSEPTRVFARWSDSNFYPGVVHEYCGGSSYVIRFDDGDTYNVDLELMRVYELRVGDYVIYNHGFRSSKVDSVDKFKSEHRVDIVFNGEVKKVLVKDLKVAYKTIQHAWGDRMIASNSITTAVKPAKPKLKASPTPSGFSVHSGMAARSQFLAKTGIAVTSTSTTLVDQKPKLTKFTDMINTHGGTIIEDWGNIIRMDGKHTNSNNRWVIEKEEVTLTNKYDIERVFLLADNPNQKAKFLIALALGIPCLSTKWLETSHKLVSPFPELTIHLFSNPL
jgi:hypothetical protein